MELVAKLLSRYGDIIVITTTIMLLGVVFLYLINYVNARTGAGLCFVFLGLAITVSSLQQKLTWKKTRGEVTRLNYREERTEFAYQVDGKTYSGWSGTDPNFQKVGNEIWVRYNPNDHQQAEHVTFGSDTYGLTFMIVGFGIFALV